MKTILNTIFATLLLMSTTINAQQRVALHNNGTTTIFSSTSPFIDAYNAAADGDTIYLPGGTFTPPANFEKKLIIFGAGHYVDSTMATGKTFINGGVQLRENADNFHIEGVEITGSVTLYNNESINGVIIKRCKINGAININGDLSNPSTSLNIIGSIIYSMINLSNAQTAILSNNIIVKTFGSSNSNLFSNNIIMGYIYGSSADYLFSGNNNTLNNNIFLWGGSTPSGYGNIFYNNIYIPVNPSYGTTPTAINNYTGVAQVDIFVNQTGVAFDYTHDYHLQNPSTYLGEDGSEVGIYGGMFPYKEGAVPVNPHIQIKNIAPQTDANGDLNIQLKVNAQDN
jgi:hypothetical protein